MKHVYLYRYNPLDGCDSPYEIYFSSFRAAKQFMFTAHKWLLDDPTVDLTLRNDNKTRLHLNIGTEVWDIFRIDVRQNSDPLPKSYLTINET